MNYDPKGRTEFFHSGRAGAHAESAVEAPLETPIQKGAMADQLGDLADAIDALEDNHYGVAVELAKSSKSARPKMLAGRHADAEKTLRELREAFWRRHQLEPGSQPTARDSKSKRADPGL